MAGNPGGADPHGSKSDADTIVATDRSEAGSVAGETDRVTPDARSSSDADGAPAGRSKLKLFGREFPLPGSRRYRVVLGVALVSGGILGFLPILGFWMIPLGLAVLSVDSPRVRRWQRRMEAWIGRWRRSRRAAKAEKQNVR